MDAAAAAAAARKKVRRPPSWKWPQPDYDEDAAAAELQAFEATMVKESAAELRGVKGVKGVKGRKRTAGRHCRARAHTPVGGELTFVQ